MGDVARSRSKAQPRTRTWPFAVASTPSRAPCGEVLGLPQVVAVIAVPLHVPLPQSEGPEGVMSGAPQIRFRLPASNGIGLDWP
jgi:hypothetical protein